ncbi:MAG TPA: T9SS type A sorting domain-containing protein [Bacteroidota bacterium]|nr:T9SS type A sorting domain-containing protein [Bacteroidota bacterium]
MKKFLLVAFFIVMGVASVYANNPTARVSKRHFSPFKTTSYPLVTIHDIQFVSADSLKIADSLGYNTGARWTLQTSAYNNDTVTVVALVTVQPRVISYTASGFTLGVVDTGSLGSQPWSGILVRYPSDSASFDADGYFDVEQGDIIEMTGTISEFPLSQMNSLTQFAPIPGTPVAILSSGHPLPPPVHLSVTDFNVGVNPGGKIKFSSAEQWESKYVYITNVTVVGNVNTSRGTFFFTDAQGNQLSDYDWSYHFTLSPSAQAQPTTPADTSYKVPPAGTVIDTIRGYVATSSGGESARGYRICPMFPGDIVYNLKAPPGVATERRYPVVVSKDSTPLVTAQAYQSYNPLAVTYPVDSVQLWYSINNGSWQKINMTAPQVTVDSTFQAHIPLEPAGTTVRYFVKVIDKNASFSILANSGFLTQYDTSGGFFFYKVLDRTAQPILSIHDIQYTPYVNGRSPYVGAVDSTGGIVTADTASLLLSPISTGGTNAYYIQSTNQPFSGLWITGPDSILAKIANGDSVIVAGQVTERADVTQLEFVTSVRIISHHNPLPAPVKLLTSVFGPGVSNGNLGAEPYEGMLVEFDTCTVANINPIFVEPTEFEVTNSSAPILVRSDGRNTYTNDTSKASSGYTVLKTGNKIGKLIGIIYYENNNYKVEPRTNSDYVNVVTTAVKEDRTVLPAQFSLEQNYPNPFNPSTTIRYAIPTAGMVTLRVYNILGQQVATLVNTQQSAGTYNVLFDASRLASGIYFYRVSSGIFTQVRKMLLLK